MFGLVRGNHPIVRTDEEIAEDVNVKFDRVLYEFNRRLREGGKCAPSRSSVKEQQLEKLAERFRNWRL